MFKYHAFRDWRQTIMGWPRSRPTLSRYFITAKKERAREREANIQFDGNLDDQPRGYQISSSVDFQRNL